MKVIVLGASGMLGSALANELAKSYEVIGLSRREHGLDVQIPTQAINQIQSFGEVDLIINAIGLIKQRERELCTSEMIAINAAWPHLLREAIAGTSTKIIQFSTDCVFSGDKGQYVETDGTDGRDLYGRSKLLGELYNEKCLTLRTSIIGHELETSVSLVDWFLSQEGVCRGYKKAIFSGLPTISVARLLKEKVIEKFMSTDIHGLYHLSVEPIAKYDLLKLIAKTYRKSIDIIPDEAVVIDRSLDSSRFRSDFEFSPPSWDKLIDEMHEYYLNLKGLS